MSGSDRGGSNAVEVAAAVLAGIALVQAARSTARGLGERPAVAETVTTQEPRRQKGELAGDDPRPAEAGLSQPGPEPGAAGRAHGRDAEGPTDLTREAWRDIAWRVRAQAKSDNIPLLSAGVAFYGLLSLFPATAAVVSIYGLVASPADVQAQVSSLTRALPPDAARLVVNQADSVVHASSGGLGLTAAVGIVTALWSASSGMKWLMSALSLAYGQAERRKFLKLRGLALLLTLGAAVALAVTFALSSGLPAVFRAVDLGSVGKVVANTLRWPLLGALIVAGLATLYRYGPNRDAAKWRWVSSGSIVAATIWLTASIGFSLYTALAGKFDTTYGAAAGIVVLMLWLYLSALSILIGAELNAEMEHQTARDTTKGPAQPRGSRRAAMADQIGEAAPT